MSKASFGSRVTLCVREAWKNVRAAPVITVVAIMTIATSLVMVGLFGFVMMNAEKLMDTMVHDLAVTVYLEHSVTKEEVETILSDLSERPEVQKPTRFYTAEQDRERNLELLGEELIQGLDTQVDVPGQPCIEFRLRSEELRRSDFEEIPAKLLTYKGVESVQDLVYIAKDLRVLLALIDLTRDTGLILCIMILAAAVFFTFSTIKLAVYARQDEIEVLRLVGATNWFIRAPFYMEGIFAGLIGSTVAITIVGTISSRLQTHLSEVQGLNLYLEHIPSSMMVWFLFGGVLLGLLGSALSVGRYLRT
jgi:cell division transport system permease protein